MKKLALKAENISKEYRLGTIGHGTLREDLQSTWAKFLGKEDPNSLVTKNHNSSSDLKHFLALNDINIEINRGERVGIIGKNGAGKSTLLKLLSRITAPTEGNIYINGKIGSLLEVGTGFHPELTGRDNIYLNGAIMGMKKNEVDKKFDEIVDFAGVDKFIDTPIKRYSSGMFVRLGFAVAAHLEPDILIVDEVLAVGDAEFQKKALGKMEEASNNEGRTVLFVSHNLASIKSLCTTGLLLKNGELLVKGNIDDVLKSYIDDVDINTHELSTKKRSGGKEKAIKKVWIENSNSSIINEIFLGEKVFVKFQFEANSLIRNPQLGLGINDSFGHRICSFGNYVISRKKLNSCYKGIGVIEIPSLTLNPGRYNISLGLSDGINDSIDYIENVFNFSVLDSDFFGTGYTYQQSHGNFFINNARIYIDD